ncbi:MAG: chorismate synthase [Candidatus Omnitrophica bacterium]|nr:chorismate synthase [Candidatus Omnitrophota bacterium]
MFNYITSGESHGRFLSAIVEGVPSGIEMDLPFINHELARRQGGYGRGGRMKIEKDEVQITAGVLKGRTTGAPIGLLLENKDFKIEQMPEISRPRPGHADLVGHLKYGEGIRAVLERASARETTMRVAAGATAKLLLREFNIAAASHVLEIGGISADVRGISFDEIVKNAPQSEVYCVSASASEKMKAKIDEARKNGDTLGGLLEVRVKGCPPGLGSYVHYGRKLDALIAAAMLSIQAVKGVTFGIGADFAKLPGSKTHDEIGYSKDRGYYRLTNHLGGIEGGMTTGEEIVTQVIMKPISTLRTPLKSVDIKTKKVEEAAYERSDICTVPALSVICENVIMIEISKVFLEKFGGDSLREIQRNYQSYLKQLQES